MSSTPTAAHKGHFSALFDLVHNQLARSFSTAQEDEIIVLTEVLASPLNYGYSTATWRALASLNGERPKGLRQLHEMYKAFQGEFLEFAFESAREKIVIDARACRESEVELLRMHAIPSPTSVGVVEELVKAR